MGGKTAKNPYLALRKRQKKAAGKRASELLPLLRKDEDWSLITGERECVGNDDHVRHLRSMTRLTKKAVRLMYPNHKVSVRRDRGTAYRWIDVNIVMPEIDWRNLRGKARDRDANKESVIRRELKDILIALGIEYATYWTDYGPGLDTYDPCLSITINQH